MVLYLNVSRIKYVPGRYFSPLTFDLPVRSRTKPLFCITRRIPQTWYTFHTFFDWCVDSLARAERLFFLFLHFLTFYKWLKNVSCEYLFIQQVWFAYFKTSTFFGECCWQWLSCIYILNHYFHFPAQFNTYPVSIFRFNSSYRVTST